MEAIIKLRKRHGAAFDEWRENVDESVATIVNQLHGEESTEALEEIVGDAVRSSQIQPLDDLRRRIKDVGFEVVEIFTHAKVELPATVGTIGTIYEANPFDVHAAAGHARRVPGAGIAAALTLFTVGRSARSAKSEVLSKSPVSYIWQVDKTLDTRSQFHRSLDVITRVVKRAAH